MPTIDIPENLHFKCIRCGKCCRGWPVGLTQKDYNRLRHYAWRRVEPQLAERKLFAEVKRFGRVQQARTALQDNGDCAFLDEDTACLIHKRLGFRAKPLGCRLYPFTIAQTPTGFCVGARFSCPAIAQGLGPPLTDAVKALTALATELYPTPAPMDADVPFSSPLQRAPWGDVLAVDEAVQDVLAYDELTLGQRLRVVERILSQMGQADMSKLSGPKLGELFEMIVPAFAQECLESAAPQPDRLDLRLVSQLLGFVHTRAPIEYQNASLLGRAAIRWRLFRERSRYPLLAAAVAWDQLPEPVMLEAVWSAPARPLEPAAAERLLFYLRVKLASRAALGAPFGSYPYIHGVRLNIAFTAIAAWFAKARALGQGRDTVTRDDVTSALEHVDMPYFSGSGGAIAARARSLCTHYGSAIADVAASLVDGGE